VRFVTSAGVGHPLPVGRHSVQQQVESRIQLPAQVEARLLVAFLASPSVHWINGQAIRVNGGIN
jgi:hypothetical protein